MPLIWTFVGKLLTHFSLMDHFYTPWKRHHRFSDVFREYRNGAWAKMGAFQKYNKSLQVVNHFVKVMLQFVKGTYLHFQFIEAFKSVSNLNSQFFWNYFNIKDIVLSPEHLICQGLSLLLF